MKRIFLFSVSLLVASSLFAQTIDDIGRISISVQRPSNNAIPAEALNTLEDKMHQIVTTGGISDNDFNKRFAITATISVGKKDIISGSPARVSQVVDVTFYVKDVVEKKEFAHATLSATGVGLNENKAFIMAFSSIKPANPNLQRMIEDSKSRIVAYYRTNCERVLAKAQTLAGQNEFDKALYLLAQVPDVCSDCMNKCQKIMVDVYQHKMETESISLLSSAKSAWAASPNAQGALQATHYISKIHPLASCQPQVESLLQEMKEKVKDDERKAWEFELQQYEDAKAREQRDFEYEREKNGQQHAKEMAMIKAGRQVALEFAKQPINVNQYYKIIEL